MKALFAPLAFLATLVFTLCGEEESNPKTSLQELVRNSTLIVDADIVQPSFYPTFDEFIVSCRVIVRVRDPLLGQAPAPEFWVRVTSRPFDTRPEPKFLNARQRCVFFLRPDDSGSTGFLGVADFASAQLYRPELVSEVQRLIKSK